MDDSREARIIVLPFKTRKSSPAFLITLYVFCNNLISIPLRIAGSRYSRPAAEYATGGGSLFVLKTLFLIFCHSGNAAKKANMR